MKTRTLRSLAVQLWLPAVVLVVLWFSTANSKSFYFPPFSEVLVALRDGFVEGSLVGDIAFSMRNVLAGLVLATVVGILLGFLIGESRSLRVAAQPFLDYLRATPMVAFIPVIILTFGIGAAPKVFLIFLGAVWPILLNTISGVHGIATAVRESARAYRIPAALRLRKVLLPAALPQIFAGIRISLSVAIVMMIVGEIYGSPHGLGHFILDAGQRFQVKDTWAGTLLIGVIGYLMTLVLLGIERVCLGWYVRRPPRMRRQDRRLAPAARQEDESRFAAV
ncbi:ABC transporter permease [Actinophytocola sp.]|uniref:ABC transporter permease n=1 Tax=Actinophytocola sp. TaxID=1872138 RepID=UPI0038998012